MNRSLLLTLTLLAASILSHAQTAQQISVRDVVAMKQAGLSDEIVIAKIYQHNLPSDLSTDDLIGLKKEKVSDAVIRALIAPKAESPATSPLQSTIVVQNPGVVGLPGTNPSGATPRFGQGTVGNSNDPLTPHDSGIYLYTIDNSGNAKMVILERTAYQGAKSEGGLASAMTYGIAKIKTKAIIPGKRADLRVANSTPTFYFYFDEKATGLGGGIYGLSKISNPSQFELLRLNVEKRSRTTEIGEVGVWTGASSGSNEKSIIAFKSKRLGPGLYKVETASDLKPGEYCFIAASGAAGVYGAGATTANDLFDFGIDTM